MRRRRVIVGLSICVSLFCLNNVYQSSTIVEVSRVQLNERLVLPLHDQSHGIQVIAGGLHNQLGDLVAENISAKRLYLGLYSGNDWRMQPLGPARPVGANRQQFLVNEGGYPNRPLVIDTIPGRRHRQSKSNTPWASKGRVIQHNETLPILDLPEGRCVLNKSARLYKEVNGTRVNIPIWQQKLSTCGRLGHNVNGTWKFVLAELLQVRIYEEDKAQWTVKELKQWFHYMYLLGVEHIFICDHYRKDSERLDVHIKRYVDHGLVTYIPWSGDSNPMQSQIRCYQHIIDNYKVHTRWQMAVDMDEYPWTPLDDQEGALVRYIRKLTRRLGTRVTEISMSNFLMLGQGDRSRDMIIDRINRMTPKPANMLVKPLYRPERVQANIHHNHLMFGNQIQADSDELRMLHYWGARGQDWGPDTNHTLSITREMNDMRNSAWPQLVRQSLIAFGEYDAFSNSTGP